MKSIPVVLGPTAVGKTSVVLRLAGYLGAEIVSADSRQIFRETSIGTAKPSTTELAAVRHHFVNEKSVADYYSAGMFEREAAARISELDRISQRIVVIGGSTLYLHALMYGLDDMPDVDDSVLSLTKQELAERGAARLHDELRVLDPEAAARIDPTKAHRIVRALSVVRSTGRPMASFFTERRRSARYRVFLLDLDRVELYRRINARVDAMLQAGLLDEVRGLDAAGFDRALAPLQTIGYKELFAHLDGQPLDEAVRLIKRNSRRYAKRQMTWFRRYDDITKLSADLPPDEIAATIAAALDD